MWENHAHSSWLHPIQARWPFLLTFYIEEISIGSASKDVQAMCK